MQCEYLGSSTNGVFCVDGLDLFKCQWRTTGKCTVVLEPETKRPHTFSLYEVEREGETLSFAAGEITPGEWAFYEVLP